jgi:hypothetical protein
MHPSSRDDSKVWSLIELRPSSHTVQGIHTWSTLINSLLWVWHLQTWVEGYTCPNISPSFADHDKYPHTHTHTRRRPCSFHLPFSSYCDVARIANILLPVDSFPSENRNENSKFDVELYALHSNFDENSRVHAFLASNTWTVHMRP